MLGVVCVLVCVCIYVCVSVCECVCVLVGAVDVTLGECCVVHGGARSWGERL